MYKVLLVDDEPLVLAGIKIMVNWEACGCLLAGNARNGQQALEAIERLRPDIVIADINMPVMDGIELLREASQRWPEIAFIMLTNLQQFELARDSLRYHASDYLVKSQLEQNVLENSLAKAKADSDKRKTMAKADLVEGVLKNNSSALLRDAVAQVISFPTVPPEAADLLENQGALQSYLLAEIQFLYPDQGGNEAADTHRNIHLWQRELVDELARNCFAHHLSTDLDLPQQSTFLLAWHMEGPALAASVESFERKLATASSNITRVQPCILATEVLHGRGSLAECRRQLFALRDSFYLSGTTPLHYGGMPGYEYRQLDLAGVADTLKIELERRNAASVNALFDKAIETIREVPHEKSEAMWLCTRLQTAVADARQNWHGAGDEGLGQAAPAKTRGLATRQDVLAFLQALKNEAAAHLQPASGRSNDIVEKAIQYVCDNIDKKIMLQDAARYACISPGYLSALFKKQYGENFVDFINRTKIQRACELIAQNQYRISQIGYMLSYENAYYFTRVFKKYMGITPSEYSEKLKKETQDVH